MALRQVNLQGTIISHTHFVVQTIDLPESTKPLDPHVFALWNTPADPDALFSVPVDAGLLASRHGLVSILSSMYSPCPLNS